MIENGCCLIAFISKDNCVRTIIFVPILGKAPISSELYRPISGFTNKNVCCEMCIWISLLYDRYRCFSRYPKSNSAEPALEWRLDPHAYRTRITLNLLGFTCIEIPANETAPRPKIELHAIPDIFSGFDHGFLWQQTLDFLPTQHLRLNVKITDTLGEYVQFLFFRPGFEP